MEWWRTILHKLVIYSCLVYRKGLNVNLTFHFPVVDCGSPEIPRNGRVNTPEGTTVGSKALYFCSKGFVLLGAEFRTCQGNGQWIPGAPVCLRK